MVKEMINKICKGDIVRHNSINFDMTVISTDGTWATCEWFDEKGFYASQKINKEHLVLIKKSISMLDAM